MTLQDFIAKWSAVDDVHPDGELKTTDEMASEYLGIIHESESAGLGEAFRQWCQDKGYVA